ncbi:MAG: hypothetical protein AAGJ35_09180 [Myxococcota bacterium]
MDLRFNHDMLTGRAPRVHIRYGQPRFHTWSITHDTPPETADYPVKAHAK